MPLLPFAITRLLVRLMFALLVLRPCLHLNKSKHPSSAFVARAFSVRMSSSAAAVAATTNGNGGAGSKLRVVTYNVLTPHYAQPRDLPVRWDAMHACMPGKGRLSSAAACRCGCGLVE